MIGLVSFAVTAAIIALLLYLFSRLDCDLSLWCAEKFGRRVTALGGKVVWITGNYLIL